jgi:phosphomannomutase
MKKTSSLKISISGVRGIVGDSLTPQLAGTFAQAFGTYIGGGPVVVGRDTRASGTMLEQAVLAGLLATGCQPVEVGICPIPSFLFLTKDIKAAGGVAVTASHNPKEWNGLKFISRDGLYLTPHQTEEFLDIYHQGEFTLAAPERYKEMKTEPEPAAPHLRKLLGHFDVGLIRRQGFKVAVDCGSGAGATLVPRLLDELGCEAILINAIPDGSFAHQPEPLPENIREICRTVVRREADVGFVQDADADRLAIVSEKGLPLGEEMTLALAAQYVLSRKKGSVVCNLSTTRAIDDIAASHKAKVIRTKIGEINVVEKLLSAEPPAAIGGEGNGGVILPDIHPCRDSFTAICLILEAMARSGKSVSALRRAVPNYIMIKDRVEGSAEQAYRLIGQLKKIYEDKGRVSLLDGMKVDFPDHWIHVRPSNTEPIIRVIAEAKTPERARSALRKLKTEIAGLRKKIL